MRARPACSGPYRPPVFREFISFQGITFLNTFASLTTESSPALLLLAPEQRGLSGALVEYEIAALAVNGDVSENVSSIARLRVMQVGNNLFHRGTKMPLQFHTTPQRLQFNVEGVVGDLQPGGGPIDPAYWGRCCNLCQRVHRALFIDLDCICCLGQCGLLCGLLPPFP
jgi:hypothetical protein